MALKFNRQVSIAVGTSRKDTSWQTQAIDVSDLYERLQTPVRSTETLDAYLKLSKAQQTDLKDVGGFVGGALSGGHRKGDAVVSRDIVTLDLDTIPPYGTADVQQTVRALGCSSCIYSTRKHMDTSPRLRILLPLDRTVSPDEYEAIARKLADMVGIQMADPTTFEPSRLMYWPSVSADGVYVYDVNDAPFVSADGVLALYADWRNWQEWPQVPGATSYQKLAVRQGDPLEKPGVVGAFNRAYDIVDAMTTFLPGIYAPCDNDPDRFTYLGGSTVGGAVLYNKGLFLYSHHATDPCSGRLVNAFDLVRLHKYGQMDDSAAIGTPVNRLPSFSAMCDMAIADSKVSGLMARERAEQALQDFGPVAFSSKASAGSDAPPVTAAAIIADSSDWMQKLQLNSKTGDVKPTIDNILIILDSDPLLKGRFALNQFAGRGEVLGVLPWSADGHRRLWSDTDSNGLYWYMEKVYKITGRGNIDAALDIHASTHAFNDVQDFLGRLTWDGVPRLDRLFIDYLGAEDNVYNRTVCRKAFVAAVARAMAPGCKYDSMLILCGPQGLGKSTLIDRMSKGWYNDNLRTFEGKEASELLQGVWLVEVAELDAFRRTDVARIKQFLSLRADRYRAAYGRNVKELPRCCVFFGTCNVGDFLQDTTGNRRFWPVDVGELPSPKNVWRDLSDAEIDQLWAEAKAYWQAGEPTYLTGEVEQMAREKQEQHREASAREGMIIDFVSKPVPEDWQRWPIDRRRDYWAQETPTDSLTLVPRDRICAIEVWCELFGGSPRDLKSIDTRDINATLQTLPGWKKSSVPVRCGPYKVQRGYVPR